jgi:hypothetical protein
MKEKQFSLTNFVVDKIKEKKSYLASIVENMLDDWSIWSRGGFPASSPRCVLGSMIANGGYYAKETYFQSGSDNPWVIQMDKWISELRRERPKEAEVLIKYYTQTFIAESLAKNLNISIRTFYERLRNAKIWLEGRAKGWLSEKDYY